MGSVVNHVDDLGSSLLASCMRFAHSKTIRLGRGSSLDLLLLMFLFIPDALGGGLQNPEAQSSGICVLDGRDEALVSGTSSVRTFEER
jgi:hypothetical protein